MLQEALETTTLPPKIDNQDVEQAGAICISRSDGLAPRILLVSSRRNGGWGLPKGHVEPGETPRAAAAREAFEEAGVSGAISPRPVGRYTYSKDTPAQRYKVTVYALEIQSIAEDFPDKAVRRSRWFSAGDAADLAGQPGLRELLRQLQL
jgi:8-oxo-dGTP pyrophosphatase MutT (NUDIX family)